MNTVQPSSLRRVVLYATPALMGLASLIHPLPGADGIGPSIEPRLQLWLAVHLGQFLLVGLLGISLGLLLTNITGTTATLSRVATVIFLVFYGAFDGIVGIGTSALIWICQNLPAADQPAAARMIEAFWAARLDPASGIPIVILGGALAWLLATAFAGLALGRAGASRVGLWLLVASGILFAIDHPFPFGTAAMVCLFGAVFFLERPSMARPAPAPMTGTGA